MFFYCFLVFKLMSRWYLTPLKFAHIYRNSSSQCWECCYQVGTYLHAWLSCKHITQFWSHILALIKRTTGIYLGLSFYYWWMLKVSLLSFGKKTQLPKVDHWLLKIWDFIVFGKVTLCLYLTESKDPLCLYNKWYPVLDFFLQHSIFKSRTPDYIKTLMYG